MRFWRKDTIVKMFLIAFGVFCWWFFTNLEFVQSKLRFLMQALTPLFIGFIIAFILNRPMMFFERTILKNIGLREKYKRALSLILTILIFFLVTFLVFIIVIPNLIETASLLKDKLPLYFASLKAYIESSPIPSAAIEKWLDEINIQQLKENITTFVRSGLFNWLGSTLTMATSIFGSLLSFFLGFVFSLYFLMQKEEITKAIKDVLYAFLPANIVNPVLHVGGLTRKAFSDFILAQSLEAVLLGSMFFVSMILFRFPYATMVSVVITVFSFIPIVGAFVGLFVGVFLIFVGSPQLAGLFGLLFLILQQIEENFVYPRVVGKISGLSPLLTLAAVTLGGSLMGVAGMLLFIPLFVVIKELIKAAVEKKMVEKLSSGAIQGEEAFYDEV